MTRSKHPDHHVWVDERCAKCGARADKVYSLVWGCQKSKSRVNRRSLKAVRKALIDEPGVTA